jgi:chemotaxis protein MotA
MLASIKGTAPIMAVEMGRRAIPEHCRPSFIEVEKKCREKAGEPASAAVSEAA